MTINELTRGPNKGKKRTIYLKFATDSFRTQIEMRQLRHQIEVANSQRNRGIRPNCHPTGLYRTIEEYV